MTEALRDERISAYLDDELDPDAREAFEQDLQSNGALQDAVRELRELRARFSDLEQLGAGVEFERRLLARIGDLAPSPAAASRPEPHRLFSADWRIWVTLAAALLAAVAIGYQVRSTWNETPIVQQGTPNIDSDAGSDSPRAEAEADESNKVIPRDPSVAQVVAQLQQREQAVILVEVVDGNFLDREGIEKQFAAAGVDFDPDATIEAGSPVELIYVAGSPRRLAWLLQNLSQPTPDSAEPPPQLRLPHFLLKDASTGKLPRQVFERYLARDQVAVDTSLCEAVEAGELTAGDVATSPFATAYHVSARQLDTLVRMDRMRERLRNRALQSGDKWDPELAFVFVFSAPE